MELYNTSNIGEYARMLRDDALHALSLVYEGQEGQL